MVRDDLGVTDVGEGLDSCGYYKGNLGRVWTPSKIRGFLFGPAMAQLVCRVCCSLEMLLMRWDTCHDLDESQNLTTISIMEEQVR